MRNILLFQNVGQNFKKLQFLPLLDHAGMLIEAEQAVLAEDDRNPFGHQRFVYIVESGGQIV
ncbi:hypothetical protein D3C80_2111640 [compost metagenome]